MRRFLAAILVALIMPRAALARSSGIEHLWTQVGRDGRASVYRVDLPSLRQQLDVAAAAHADLSARPNLTLPLPDGRIEPFRVVEFPLLSSKFHAEHPELRTYAAVGTDDASITARIDVTPWGAHAIEFSPHGVALLDPGKTSDVVCAYWSRDAADGPFDCLVLGSRSPTSGLHSQASGDVLKTIRFALLGTGEYTSVLGGVGPATGEMLASMDRIDAIFERDAAVRLEVVGIMAFPDSTTDPYSSTTIVDLVSANTGVASSVFGGDNFDLAQVLSHAGGPWPAGASFESNLCTEDKGGSAVVGPDPGANWYMLKIMAHEIGHMLGATHTQDADCNRDPATPYEPGSGSTIMSYGGKCPPYDVVTWADPYFHSASIEQMVNGWMSFPGCGTTQPTGNALPVANAGPDYTIPRQTPFVLVGGGFDPDPWDTLTYCWEEMDKAPTSHDSTSGPLFRSRPPSLSPAHAYPALATVLSNTSDPYEGLPPVDRTMHFRLTVRDNHPGTGGVAWDEMTITVSGPPFAVTSPHGGESFAPDQDIPVTWNLGGGGVAADVDILVSSDAGQSWRMLEANTPNDGSETVSYHPAQTSSACRIKVQSVGNVFYAVSDSDFRVAGVPTDVHERPPIGFVLEPPLPDPSRGLVSVDFSLPRDAKLDLAVYSPGGRRLKTLASGSWPAGRHRILWDGTNDAGSRVRTGVYFLRGTSDGISIARRVTLLR